MRLCDVRSLFRQDKNLLGALAVVLGGFFVAFGFSTPVFAEPSITLNIQNSTASIGITPSSNNGTFSNRSPIDGDYSNISLQVTLTGSGGYTLGIRPSTTGENETKLVNTSDSSAFLSSITAAVSLANYQDDTYALAHNLNNTWGYRPSKYHSEANSDYRPAPTANGDILDETNGTNDTGSYTIGIGARAGVDAKLGTYSNTYVITAVANHACNPNATDILEALCMQDMNDTVINSMETGRQYQLKDNRDWKKYFIAKMKDGRVWMTQNLDLDLETTATNVAALTSLNTDLNTFGTDNYDTNNGYACSNTNSSDCQGSGEVITWTPGSATTTTASSWSTDNNIPQSFDYGEQYRYVSTTGTTTTFTSTTECVTAHPDGTCPHYHLGNYYSWSAAVASNSTSGLTANYKVMGNSICPAGWRLPAGKTSTTSSNPGYYSEANYTWKMEGIIGNFVAGTGSAAYLTNGWNNIRNNPLYYAAAGQKTSSTLSNLGTHARLWTSTIYNSSNAYQSYVYSSYSYPSATYTKSNGISVRCVARQENTGHTTITYDKNASDATGTTANQPINANTFGNISNNGYTRSGYAFNSWNTEPDGSGTTYNVGDQFYAITGTATTNVTLYAQWDKLYTITFSLAGNATKVIFDGTEYTNGQTAQAIEGKTYSIAGDYATKHGFYNWSATAGTIAAQQPVTTYTVPTSNATVTLTGQEATINMSSLPISSDPVSSTCIDEAITPILVYDPRDNEAYWVARLCDGNYWMLDNLRLDLTNSTVINSLSESNTNASATALNYLKNGGGTSSDQWPTTGLTGSNWTSSSSYSAPLVNVSGSVTAGTSSNTWTGNYTKDTVAPTTYGLGSGKIGAYYNYCAASAGTYCWGNGASSTGSPTSDPNTTTNPTARDIEGDICPKGWRMPTGGDIIDVTTGGGEYQNLKGKYSNIQQLPFVTALSTPLSGISYGGSASWQGTKGDFWSSTWVNYEHMRYLEVNSGNAIQSSDSRYFGRSVRCLYSDTVTITVNFDGGVESVTFTGADSPSQVTTTTSGSEISLENGKAYTVAINYILKHGFYSWSATAGMPTNSNVNVTSFIPSGNATISIASQEATVDMTTLTASSDPVSNNCKNEAVNPVLVYDSRDNEAYYVARLCDGNYWMLDNLRLDLTNPTIINILSSSNTNASDEALNHLRNGDGATDDQWPTAGLTGANWTSSYSYSAPLVNVSGSVAASGSNTWSGNYNKNTAAPHAYGLGTGKIGVYYNYCAASAGTYCWGNGTSYTGSPSTDPNTTSSPTARDIEGDICPKGWRMPTSSATYNFYTGSGEYKNLYNKYSGGGSLGGETVLTQNVAFKTALSIPYSGYIDNRVNLVLLDLGIRSYFLSSTWLNTNEMYSAEVSSVVSTAINSARSLGKSVRCILGS